MEQKRKTYLGIFVAAAFIFVAGLSHKVTYVFAEEAAELVQDTSGEHAQQEVESWKVTKDSSGRMKAFLKGYQLSNVYLILQENAQNSYTVVPQPGAGGSIYYFDGSGYGRKYLSTGIVPIFGDFGTELYYVANGTIAVSQSDSYVVSGNYMYRVRPSGAAAIWIANKNNSGTYCQVFQGICYQVSYQTGKAEPYTGIFRDSIYKKGKVATLDKAYYTIYKGYCYKASKSGKVAVYIKNSKKKGTYQKKIDGICYQINYKTGAAKKYTGWYKGKYYKKGALYTGWLTIASEKSYIKKGIAKTGWVTVGTKKYYFNKKGVLLKNQIVGSNYVDKQGVCVKDKVIRQAVKFVNSHSSASHSNAARLKECYTYLWKRVAYKRTYGIPGRADMDDIAYSMFCNKYGNCFCYASTFAYIARVLGYDSRVTVGELPSRRGGMTPHGWAEVYVNGKWLFCDPDMQMNYPRINVYMRSESQYPYRHNIHHRYRLKVSKGKVAWKV